MLNVTAEISPIRCWIKQSYFYNLDQTKTEYERCEIFAVSSYINEYLNINVKILSNGGLFHDLPIYSAKTNKETNNEIEYGKLVYHKCPSNNITVNEFKYLSGKCWVYFKEWYRGEYHSTIDWFENNQNAHLISLENGQFCCMPSHKVLFTDKIPEFLPDYKKKRF